MEPPGVILKASGPDFGGPGLDFGAPLRKMILQPRKGEKRFNCKNSGDHTEKKANAKANAKAKVKGKATAEAKAEQGPITDTRVAFHHCIKQSKANQKQEQSKSRSKTNIPCWIGGVFLGSTPLPARALHPGWPGLAYPFFFEAFFSYCFG